MPQLELEDRSDFLKRVNYTSISKTKPWFIFKKGQPVRDNKVNIYGHQGFESHQKNIYDSYSAIKEEANEKSEISASIKSINVNSNRSKVLRKLASDPTNTIKLSDHDHSDNS